MRAATCADYTQRATLAFGKSCAPLFSLSPRNLCSRACLHNHYRRWWAAVDKPKARQKAGPDDPEKIGLGETEDL